MSVLENSNFYGGNKKEYWRHKSGKKTHRDYLREDVEYCLSFATSPREFESQLYALGYTLDPVRFSVKAKHWERSVRLANIGFTKEIVQAQLDKNAESRYHLFTLEYAIARLSFLYYILCIYSRARPYFVFFVSFYKFLQIILAGIFTIFRGVSLVKTQYIV